VSFRGSAYVGCPSPPDLAPGEVDTARPSLFLNARSGGAWAYLLARNTGPPYPHHGASSVPAGDRTVL
jgi:hypothetical protein